MGGELGATSRPSTSATTGRASFGASGLGASGATRARPGSAAATRAALSGLGDTAAPPPPAGLYAGGGGLAGVGAGVSAGGSGSAGGGGGSGGSTGAKDGSKAIMQPSWHSYVLAESHGEMPKPGGQNGSAPGNTSILSVCGLTQRFGHDPQRSKVVPSNSKEHPVAPWQVALQAATLGLLAPTTHPI